MRLLWFWDSTWKSAGSPCEDPPIDPRFFPTSSRWSRTTESLCLFNTKRDSVSHVSRSSEGTVRGFLRPRSLKESEAGWLGELIDPWASPCPVRLKDFRTPVFCECSCARSCWLERLDMKR